MSDVNNDAPSTSGDSRAQILARQEAERAKAAEEEARRLAAARGDEARDQRARSPCPVDQVSVHLRKRKSIMSVLSFCLVQVCVAYKCWYY